MLQSIVVTGYITSKFCWLCKCNEYECKRMDTEPPQLEIAYKTCIITQLEKPVSNPTSLPSNLYTMHVVYSYMYAYNIHSISYWHREVGMTLVVVEDIPD